MGPTCSDNLVSLTQLTKDADDGDTNSQPLGYKPSALAIELNSSKAIAGKELSLSSWCIASLYQLT